MHTRGRDDLEQPDHIILDVTPLLVTAHKDYGTVPLYASQLKNSSNRIQAVLHNMRKYNRNRVLKHTAVYTCLTLTLVGMYYGYIYGAVKFFEQDNPSMISYRNTKTNGTTCDKLFTLKGAICNYENPTNIPEKAAFALYCAKFVSNLIYWNADIIKSFVDNCYVYLPNINVENFSGMTGAVFACMSYVAEWSHTKIDFNAYQNMTLLINGTEAFCQDLLYFANETAYNTFREGLGNTCWNFGINLFYALDSFNRQYTIPVSELMGSCADRFPILPYNFSLGMNNFYNLIPAIAPCFEKASHWCRKAEFDFNGDDWHTPTRDGLISLGVFIAIGLVCYLGCLIWCIKSDIKHRNDTVFADLPIQQRDEIQRVTHQFADNPRNFADDCILDNVKDEIKKSVIANDVRVSQGAAFIEATESSLTFFSERDKDCRLRDEILKQAKIRR